LVDVPTIELKSNLEKYSMNPKESRNKGEKKNK
jgi:hypothetical protein